MLAFGPVLVSHAEEHSKLVFDLLSEQPSKLLVRDSTLKAFHLSVGLAEVDSIFIVLLIDTSLDNCLHLGIGARGSICRH